MNITKAAVKTALGLSTDVEVASFFKTTKQAVWRWPDNDPIPQQRQWQLMVMRPDVFSAQTEQRTEDTQRPEQKRAA